MFGKLYIIATPIGNLGDITYRAVEILKSVDFIATEDTRVSSKLLNHLSIKKPLISYYEHNLRGRGEIILSRLLAGESCALISDAGTPAVSDPGEDLVRLCAASSVEIIGVPGACAAITALSISGQNTSRFTFEGFLANSKKNRYEHLNLLKNEYRTIILYEAPHKLCKTLDDLYTVLGDRSISLAREITKMHEQVLRTTLSDAIEFYKNNIPRGEFVLIIEGYRKEIVAIDNEILLEKVVIEINNGLSVRDAVKRVSEKYSVPKNALYKFTIDNIK